MPLTADQKDRAADVTEKCIDLLDTLDAVSKQIALEHLMACFLAPLPAHKDRLFVLQGFLKHVTQLLADIDGRRASADAPS